MLYEEVKKITVERKVITKITCELCNTETPPNGLQYTTSADWSGGRAFDVSRVEISLKEGKQYPEIDIITTHVLDICPKCFLCKLVPWFESQGGTVRDIESE